MMKNGLARVLVVAILGFSTVPVLGNNVWNSPWANIPCGGPAISVVCDPGAPCLTANQWTEPGLNPQPAADPYPGSFEGVSWTAKLAEPAPAGSPTAWGPCRTEQPWALADKPEGVKNPPAVK